MRTGPQQPMASPFTDAKLNLYQSLLFAADDRSCDVSVVFGGAVIAGTRARKQRTMSFNAFTSVNFPELAPVRGEPNVQGSTDHALLSHYLPGYLKAPKASWPTLEQYIAGTTPQTANPQSLNWMSNTGTYATSLLRAFYPEGGTPENGFGYDYLPKLDDGQDASALSTTDAMYAGKIKAHPRVGHNPACSHTNSNNDRTEYHHLQ